MARQTHESMRLAKSQRGSRRRTPTTRPADAAVRASSRA